MVGKYKQCKYLRVSACSAEAAALLMNAVLPPPTAAAAAGVGAEPLCSSSRAQRAAATEGGRV